MYRPYYSISIKFLYFKYNMKTMKGLEPTANNKIYSIFATG